MSAGGFEIDVDALTAHAGRLHMVTDAVALAGDAANQVDLDGGAFGLLCAMLPMIVNGAEQDAGRAINAARGALEAMSEGVLGMARDYATVDEAVSARMAALGAR
jgi:hypothetical protein